MNKLKDLFKKAAKLYGQLEISFLIIFTLAIGALIIIEILRRLFHITGLKWIEEMGRYMLITTTLVGCSVAVKSKGHAVMDFLYAFVPDRVKFMLQILVNTLCGAGFLYIGVYSALWTKELIVLNRSMESITVPMWPIWVIVTLAFLSTGVRYFIELKNCIGKIRRGEPFNEIVQKEM